MNRFTKEREHRHREYHFKKLPTIVEPVHLERINNPVRLVLVRVNVIRPICSVVLGRNHSVLHRMMAGFVVAAVGVFIAKHGAAYINEYIADGFGYGLHGIGLVPFIEYLSEHFE